MMWYAIRSRETGTVIECCFKAEIAQEVVQVYEEIDRENGVYEADFYEVVKANGAPEVADRDEYDYDVLDITRAYLGIDY